MKAPRAAAWLALSTLLTGCYVTRLAYRQNELYNSRRPIADVLAQPFLAGETRGKLRLVETLLAYSRSQELAVGKAYRCYVELASPSVSFLVYAAHKDRLEPVTWWFPVVGRVPYRGYFEREEREAKARELAAAGYDVHRAGAAGFSSLGWFEDPIYSSMLRRRDAQLAELIFHELAHRTLWWEGRAELNEQMASYVGEALTRAFLASRGWSEELRWYERRTRDEERFRVWLNGLRSTLARELVSTVSREERLARRDAIYARFLGERPAFEAVDFVGSRPWNNARVLASSMYVRRYDEFERLRQCSGAATMGAFLRYLRAHPPAEEDLRGKPALAPLRRGSRDHDGGDPGALGAAAGAPRLSGATRGVSRV